MRLLICAGGTGGGVSPALAVLEALMTERQTSGVERSTLDVLWVGGESGMEARLVERAGVPFRTIPAAGVHGVGLRQLPRNLRQLLRGVGAARRILGEFKPDVLFFTGGYLAVPMAVAGRRVPTLLCVPDIEPGLALKVLSRFADCITVPAEESLAYYKDRKWVVPAGYPVRSELRRWTRQSGREALHLSNDVPVLLVTGGSKGARSINTAVLKDLPALLEMAEVVHISGELDWPTVEAEAKRRNNPGYHAFPYLDEKMGAALAAADLVLSRAGASTLGEYPLFGLPAILVPYPYAWRYQKVNASYLVDHGAAILLEDELLPEKLLSTVKSLLNDPARLAAMRDAMKELSRPQAAVEISRQLPVLAGGRR